MKVLQKIDTSLSLELPNLRLNVIHIKGIKNVAQRCDKTKLNMELLDTVKHTRVRVSNMRQLLPLESFDRLSKTYNSQDIRLVARDSAFIGLQRAIREERFESINFKTNFTSLTTANGALRTMVTGLKGITEFDSGDMKKIASEILNTYIYGVPFSQFGTCSGLAKELVTNATAQQQEEIVRQINIIFDKVSLYLVGSEV
ncbi:hypothetical protein O1C03_001790 [Vibrio cholerae]|uniref:hypothetical protein n=1 Tax=Vibrio cholerae TaxID=666 RepID=UPI0030806999|nr:hypothetical protein [Vibrio cholerae]